MLGLESIRILLRAQHIFTLTLTLMYKKTQKSKTCTLGESNRNLRVG